MAFVFQQFCLLLFLIFMQIEQQVYSIKGPTHIKGSIGQDALFMWNTTDQKEIVSSRWGIRKGNKPDPQFISVNSHNGKVNINEDIDATLKKRVEFIGNLTIGRAWFVLKNLTVNDTNEYIASIMHDVSRVLPYYVHLMVVENREVTTTKGPSRTPVTTAVAKNIARAPTNKTTTSSNITTPPKPNSSNILRHIEVYLILMDIALVMSHS